MSAIDRTRKAAHAQRTSRTDRHGTPRAVIDLARAVLGRIDLDPFSADEWNVVVGADRILTAKDDAYRCAWFPLAAMASHVLTDANRCGSGDAEPHTALVNPPGSMDGANVKRAWLLTEWHHRTGWLGGGVLWVSFSTHQLQTTQQSGAARSMLSFPLCIPSSRLAYQSAPGVRGAQPPHPSALVLLPSLDRAEADRQRQIFALVAGRLGEVRL